MTEEEEKIKMIEDIQFFLKELWCIDGEATFHAFAKPFLPELNTGLTFKLDDQRRGVFYVTIHKPKK